MKLKQLAASISQLVQFQNPKIDLEQYSTGAHIASRMLYTADNSFGDICGKVVADFGCGCGTLGVAASLLSADYVIGIDIDAEALDLAKNNSDEFEIASSTVYSLHKTTTRDYVRRTALRDFGAKTAEVLCELRYDLPALYKFHKKQEVDIMVDLWRFTI